VRLKLAVAKKVPTDSFALQELESKYKVYSLYQWLSYRLDDEFTAKQAADLSQVSETERAHARNVHIENRRREGGASVASSSRYYY
jgi:hypothetical protein